MRNFNPFRSRAVLVGVARTASGDRWQDLPQVPHNLRRLKEILTDPDLVGMRDEDCTILLDPEDRGRVMDALQDAADEAEDTVLFYYSGHGFPRDDELHLTLRSTSGRNQRYNSLDLRTIKAIVQARRGDNAVVIIDSCYSGLAHGMGDYESFLDTAIQGSNAYLLTSSARDQQSLALPGEEFTAFSGELIGVLADGVASAAEYLTMDTVSHAVKARLAHRGMPLPRYTNSGTGQQLAVLRNQAFRTDSLCLPVYIAVDVSRGLRGAPIEAINNSLLTAIGGLGREVPDDYRVQVSIIEYADEAYQVLPLQDADSVTQLPHLTAGGGIQLSPLFETLRDCIISDVGHLRSTGRSVSRPVVGILLSGKPEDPAEWPAEHDRLSQHRTRRRFPLAPEIVSLGFADADMTTLQKVATRFAFMAKDANPVGQLSELLAHALTAALTENLHAKSDPDAEPAEPRTRARQPVEPEQFPSARHRRAEPEPEPETETAFDFEDVSPAEEERFTPLPALDLSGPDDEVLDSFLPLHLQGAHDSYRIAGDPVSRGGAGSIYRTTDPERVLKIYHSRDLTPPLGHQQHLMEIGRDVLIRRHQAIGALPESSINWPVDLVENLTGRVVGCVLPAVPERYYLPNIGAVQTLDFLIMRRARPPSARFRLIVLLRLAEILAYVHSKQLVHGDVNAKNVLWTIDPEPSAYLIDCDGMVPQQPPPSSGVAAPFWTDPRVLDRIVPAHDHYSDWYCLALAFYRGLLLPPGGVLSKQNGVWPAPAQIPADLDPRVTELIMRGLADPLDPRRRPEPSEWISTLIAVYVKRGAYDENALSRLDATGIPPVERSPGFHPLPPAR